jgi:hypothetical protein
MITTNFETASAPVNSADPGLGFKLTIEREPGCPLEIDTRKRTFLVSTPTGHWGRSNVGLGEAAWEAIKSGANPLESGIIITVIGDDDARIEAGGHVNFAENSFNCGFTPVAGLIALIVVARDGEGGGT